MAAVAVLRLRLQKPHNTVYALGSPAAAYNYRRSLNSGKKLFVVLSYAAKGLEGEIHRIQLITYQVVGQRRGYLRTSLICHGIMATSVPSLRRYPLP